MKRTVSPWVYDVPINWVAGTMGHAMQDKWTWSTAWQLPHGARKIWMFIPCGIHCRRSSVLISQPFLQVTKLSKEGNHRFSFSRQRSLFSSTSHKPSGEPQSSTSRSRSITSNISLIDNFVNKIIIALHSGMWGNFYMIWYEVRKYLKHTKFSIVSR